MGLSITEMMALACFGKGEVHAPYDIGAELETLRALEKRGILTDVTPIKNPINQPMYPNRYYKFKRSTTK